RAGQSRGSSILLRYPEGGVNHPHHDIYGPERFPYQAVLVLSQRGREFNCGEFELHEKQANGSRNVRRFPLDQGELWLFAGSGYWRRGPKRPRWIDLEHGMRRVTRGERYALGIVLHLAQ